MTIQITRKRAKIGLAGETPKRKMNKKINGHGLTTKQILERLDARSKKTLEKLISSNRRKR